MPSHPSAPSSYLHRGCWPAALSKDMAEPSLRGSRMAAAAQHRWGTEEQRAAGREQLGAAGLQRPPAHRARSTVHRLLQPRSHPYPFSSRFCGLWAAASEIRRDEANFSFHSSQIIGWSSTTPASDSTVEAARIGNRLGMNQFADLTNDEFRAAYLGARAAAWTGRVAGERYHYDNVDVLPENIDWREKEHVAPVKDQGQCEYNGSGCSAWSGPAADGTAATATGDHGGAGSEAMPSSAACTAKLMPPRDDPFAGATEVDAAAWRSSPEPVHGGNSCREGGNGQSAAHSLEDLRLRRMPGDWIRPDDPGTV